MVKLQNKKLREKKIYICTSEIFKYPYVISILRLHNIHLEHKFKWLLCKENPVVNVGFIDF